MNPYTGEVRGFELGEAIPKDFNQLPSSLDHAAKRKLNGKKSAMVSLTSGGLLSRHAASIRKAKRKLARSSRRKNRSN